MRTMRWRSADQLWLRAGATGLCTLTLYLTAHADVIYVDDDAPPGGDGTSWATAFDTVEDAVDVAGSDDEIWVAAGDYGDVPLDDESLYGGFAGHETDFDDRDWITNTTFMTPDVGGSTARVDGFTAGNLHVGGGSPWIENCTLGRVDMRSGAATFVRCQWIGLSSDLGSAMEIRDAEFVTIRDCLFADNSADSCCAVYILNSQFLIEGCEFRNNYGVTFPALGIIDFNTSLFGRVVGCSVYENCGEFNSHALVDGRGIETINCVFSRNENSGPEPGNYLSAGASTLINCTFSRNSGGGPRNGTFDEILTIRNCIAWENGGENLGLADVAYSCIEGGAGGPGNIDADPLFVQAGTDDIRLAAGSPCINAGSNDAVPSDILDDFLGLDRIQDDIVDMGAIEGTYEAELPAEDADDVDPFEAVLLSPIGDFDPFENPAVLFANVGEQEDGYVIAIQHEDVPDVDRGLVEIGFILEVDSTLQPGDIVNTVYIPFDADDLDGLDPLNVNIAIRDPEKAAWVLAVEYNVGASPGHDGPVGDRIVEVGDDPPSYSPDVGDWGVYWNPTLERGIAWAMTDTLGHYGIGVALCAADVGGPGDQPDGIVDVIDLTLLLQHFGTTDVQFDLDGDGVVGILDLLALLGAWGACR